MARTCIPSSWPSCGPTPGTNCASFTSSRTSTTASWTHCDGCVADLARAVAMLSAEKFDKMIAYLHSPAAQRVRTNNHVERTNRKLRYLEKVRYKWRRRRTIVRFVILALDRWRQKKTTAEEAKL